MVHSDKATNALLVRNYPIKRVKGDGWHRWHMILLLFFREDWWNSPKFTLLIFSVTLCHPSPFSIFWLREREGIAIVISGGFLGITLSYCIYYVFVFINHIHRTLSDTSEFSPQCGFLPNPKLSQGRTIGIPSYPQWPFPGGHRGGAWELFTGRV